MQVKQHRKWKGHDLTITWIEKDDFEDLSPITQVSGVCFTPQEEVMVIDWGEGWLIPGGTPEKGEKLIRTLKRELWEEARVKIGKVKPLGYFKVYFPDNPNEWEGEIFYQVRYGCLIEEVYEMGPDPDRGGKTAKRKFIEPEKFPQFVTEWGRISEALIEAAERKLNIK